jgi:hypothetical protein
MPRPRQELLKAMSDESGTWHPSADDTVIFLARK